MPIKKIGLINKIAYENKENMVFLILEMVLKSYHNISSLLYFTATVVYCHIDWGNRDSFHCFFYRL